MSVKERIFYPALIFMIFYHVMALVALPFYSTKALVVTLVLYLFTGMFGITMGFHRYFTHKGFKTYSWFENFLAICGTLAFQGPMKRWVREHRVHHIYSDKPGDPHSPYYKFDGSKEKNKIKGFIHAHFSWMMFEHPYTKEQIKLYQKLMRDFNNKKFLNILSEAKGYILAQLILAVFLFLIFDFSVMMWGIFVRQVFVSHLTWFVNSASHVWGYENYKAQDNSKNLWWVALLTYGEGWHNNHHAFGNCVRHGHKWWELDFTFYTVKILEKLGIVWDLNMDYLREKQDFDRDHEMMQAVDKV